MRPRRLAGDGRRMGRTIRAAYAALKQQRSPWDVIGITLGIVLCAALCAAGVVVAYYAVHLLIGLFTGLWAFGLAIGWVVHELCE
jgi:hypothetical protein